MSDEPLSRPPDAAREPRWRNPPSLAFHAVLAVMLAVAIWSQSFPGEDTDPFLLAALATMGLGVVWVVKLLGWKSSAAKAHSRRWLLGPAMVVVALVLLMTGASLRTRFELARSDFNGFVEHLEPQGSFTDWVPIEAPDQLGSYGIQSAYQVGENVIVYEANGDFFDDAGFAYLPHGPDSRLGNGSFEAPSFRSLGGGWYSWTASW